MTDRRETPFNGRVAHVSLKGQVTAERFTEGESTAVEVPLTPLLDAPGGNRERELLLGQRFRIIDETPGWAFGFAERDGYVGYVSRDALRHHNAPTHRVSARQTYAKTSPGLKITEPTVLLSFGAEVHVTGQQGDWLRVHLPLDAAGPRDWWLPAPHLTPASEPAADPVEIAALFLGAPYLWGGNSAFGIDCSGLVQAAALACGLPCPGDSDQQARAFGGAPLDAPTRRGDLFFWKGHVALAIDADTLIHANAHTMNVATEAITLAIARIETAGDGPVTARGHLGR